MVRGNTMNKPAFLIERMKGEAWIKQLETRVVILRAGTFVDLQKNIEALIGDEASALFYDAGIRAGKGSAEVQLQAWKERGMDFLGKWGKFYGSSGCGWFKVEDINVDSEKGGGYIRVKQSFIAEVYGKSEKPVCHFLCGFFVGVLEKVLGERLTCEEFKCIAKGDSYCEFRFEKL